MTSVPQETWQQDLTRLLHQMGVMRKYLRPRGGWLRMARRHNKISAGEVAQRMGVSRQLPLQFEKAEVDDRITLKSLRRMADALDCDLVYALIPKVREAPRVVDGKKDLQSTLASLRKLL